MLEGINFTNEAYRPCSGSQDKKFQQRTSSRECSDEKRKVIVALAWPHNSLSHDAPRLHNSLSHDASFQRPRPPLALPCGSRALALLAVAMAMGVQGGGVCPKVHSSAVFSPLQVALSAYMSQGLQHLLRLVLYTACSSSLLLLTEAAGSSIDVGEIFVGNLDFRLRKADVVCAFSQWGQVVEVYERF